VSVAVQEQPSRKRGTSDNRAFLDELWRCLPTFAVQSASLPAEARGSFEWLAAAGQFWWTAREEAGVSREDAARALGCSTDRLRLLEFGLVSPGAFATRRWRGYASRLGDPGLYQQYRDRFER
jgi:hypothetical protein